MAVSGLPALTSDVRTDGRFSKRRSVMDLGLRSILCAPRLSMTVTLFCARLEPGSGTATYVNAGHNPPLLAHGADAGAPFMPLPPSGTVLGAFPDSTLEQRTLRLDPGDLLLSYTNGVIDARNSAGEAFAGERLDRLLRQHGRLGAGWLVDALKEAVQEFAGGEALYDDVTLAAAMRLQRADRLVQTQT